MERFDRVSLQEGAAALALWPGNVDRHAALQELIEVLGAEPNGDGPPIEAEDWAAWLASEDAQQLQGTYADGLCDAPLAVEAVLLGHRRALLGGALEWPVLHFQLWMEAIVGGPVDDELEGALKLLMAGSSLCDLVVQRAGLGGYKWPHPHNDVAIAAPPGEELQRLRAALRFAVEEPEPAELIEPLVSGSEPQPWQPLRRLPDSSLLVAEPWNLSLSVLVRAVAQAASSPRFAEVTERLSHLVLETATVAAEEMDWKVERVEDDHFLALVDVDCEVVVGVAVIPPDPARFSEEELSADAHLPERYAQLAARAHSLGVSHSLLVGIGDGRALTVQLGHPLLRMDRESDPWVAGIGELQAIGEGLRNDPLGLPAVLRTIPRPPWPENYDLLDAVGEARKLEERDLEGAIPSDPTEFMLLQGRVRAMRHPALFPDLSHWVEVIRWEGDGDLTTFRSRDSEQFALLTRAPGRSLWVSCDATFEQRWELLPVIATALAFWLGRLCKAGFLEEHAREGQVNLHFHLELDRRPGPQLAVGWGDRMLRLVAGEGFVNAFCLGDNAADRTLAGAVLGWARGAGIETRSELLDEVLPVGPGTFAVWPSPQVESNEPLLESPPPIEPRARQEVELELAASQVKPGEVAVVSDESLEEVLEDLARTLEREIQTMLDSLEPGALLDLVSLHERLGFDAMNESILLPALSVIRGEEGVPLIAKDSPHRELALRILIERAAASPPAGAAPLSQRRANWLRAAAELQLQLRSALDAVRYERAGGRLVISTLHGIQISLGGDLPAAGFALFEQISAAAPDLMAIKHESWWGGEPVLGSDPVLDAPIELPGRWPEVDAALREEWGVGIEQLMRILVALKAIAEAMPGCVVSQDSASLRHELSERTRIGCDAVAAALERLTLGPCSNFDTFGEAHQPGRANRERSYIRRPLVALPSEELGWSSLHCVRSGEYLIGLIESGRLRVSEARKKPVLWVSQELDCAFEDALLEKVHGCGWQGMVRVEALDGKPLRRARGQQIGDVDVLAWSMARREVWLLDAKRMSTGVEPGRMLLEGSDFEKYVKRHEERLQWVLDHLPALGREIEADDISGWRVRAALVLDRPLAGAHLKRWPIPIWTLWGLPRALNELPGSSPE